jgi:uncharacterized membrane-anchored protein YhcB (DUF1043 family)
MENAVVLKDNLDFSVDFKQSEITVANKEQFEQAIKAYASKYENLIIDENNVADAKNVRVEINKVKKGLDEKRREIKKNFNEPLKQFESWVKDQSGEIEKVLRPIDQGIKELEEIEKQKRKNSIEILVKEMCETHKVEFEDVEIQASWWEPSGAFTKTNKPTKKTIEAISFALNQIAEKQKQLESDILIVSNYAQAIGLESESWSVQVKNGSTPAQLMKMMDEAIREKKAKQEYEEAMAKLEKESAEIADTGVFYDPETGEVVSENLFEDELPFDVDDPFPDIPTKEKSVLVRLTGPDYLLIQARQYILSLGIRLEDIGD